MAQNIDNITNCDLGPLGTLLAWTDRHPVITGIILTIEALTAIYGTLTYNFTTTGF